jgi:hypothetical protein
MSGHGLDLFSAVFCVARTIARDVGERANPNNPLRTHCFLGISVAFKTTGEQAALSLVLFLIQPVLLATRELARSQCVRSEKKDMPANRYRGR